MLETGPKFKWTRDNKIFDHYQIWKEKVELIFTSTLAECTPEQKVSYLRYWMSDQGIPLVKKWTALGKLDFSNPVEIPATETTRRKPILSGFILKNYWDLLEAKFKPKGNKLLSVIELWTRSKRGSKTLSKWLTYVHNLVEICDYSENKDRIIRDVLIIGCNSDKAKDKIVQQGEKIKLQEVIEILQIEDSTRQTLSEMSSTVQKISYVSYEKKKSKGGKNKQNNPNNSSSSSSSQKQDSTGSGKLCYQCKKPNTKGHENVCKARNVKCDGCGTIGHYKIACKKSGNFPKKLHSNPQNSSSTGRMNIAAAVKETPMNADFFNEKGLPKEYQPNQMNVLSGRSSTDEPIFIKFGCGLTPLSFDRKLTLMADTGADANAINKKTFDELFPNVELEESTFLLQNFDKQLVKPIGSFRCFLRWKGHKYRVKIEVMGADTPNILSRETTFLMGILKRCLPVEKVPIKQTNTQSNHIPIPVSDQADRLPSTEVAFSHSVPSTEGVFSHSDTSVEENLPCHSVPSMEEGSQMNCASISEMAEPPEIQISLNSGSNNHSLSIADLPLTQEKVKTAYADIFQGLEKFPGDPYKFRLKPDAVPAKHRPRKVPVHLQEAFHEEVQ